MFFKKLLRALFGARKKACHKLSYSDHAFSFTSPGIYKFAKYLNQRGLEKHSIKCRFFDKESLHKFLQKSDAELIQESQTPSFLSFLKEKAPIS